MKIESLADSADQQTKMARTAVSEDHETSARQPEATQAAVFESLKTWPQRPGAGFQKHAAELPGTAEPRSLSITDIRQGVKNPNRANIFINGKYKFSLDISQLVDYKLKIGKSLTQAELSELQAASEFGKLYQRALEWVLTRPRSVKETRDYLRRKIYDKKLNPDYIDRIIDRLAAKHYLDDTTFATYYIENRFVKKGISQKRLRLELVKKGLAPDLIEQALATTPRDDAAEAKKIIARKRKKYPDDDKLIQYLCRQGFSYQLARSLIQDSETD